MTWLPSAYIRCVSQSWETLVDARLRSVPDSARMDGIFSGPFDIPGSDATSPFSEEQQRRIVSDNKVDFVNFMPAYAPPFPSGNNSRPAPAPAPTPFNNGYRRLTDLPSPSSAPYSFSSMAYNSHQQLPANNLATAHPYKGSSSPEPETDLGAQGKPHRRGYQACQHCRCADPPSHVELH